MMFVLWDMDPGVCHAPRSHRATDNPEIIQESLYRVSVMFMDQINWGMLQ